MMLVNGQPADQLPVMDRGLQYGDGLFETMRAEAGAIIDWPRHLQRLQSGCDKLRIPCPEVDALEADLAALLNGITAPVVLKLIVTRGSGGRGYRFQDSMQPTRIVSRHPLPEYPRHYSESGIELYACETRLGMNPALAGVKHLNRLEQVMARNEWQDDVCAEGLMCDTEGFPIEGTMSNLFWFDGETLCTPELTQCGVAGVMRGRVIETAESAGVTVAVARFPLEALLDSDGVFVCNSLIGLWPVRKFLARQWPIHARLIQLQEQITDLV